MSVLSLPPGRYDIATDEEFSPDKLRANLERLYMTVIVGVAAFGKHVARLRSWNKPRRTIAFALAYFASWYFNSLSTMLLSTLLVLIFCPSSRSTLFPPAPLAAVSTTTGNLQDPRAGTLGSGDSLIGAPEAHQGGAVEREASHFVVSIAAIGTWTILGQGGTPNGKGGEVPGGDDGDAGAGKMEMGTGTERAEATERRSCIFSHIAPSTLLFATRAAASSLPPGALALSFTSFARSATSLGSGSTPANESADKGKLKKRGSKLVGLLKKTTRAGVGGVLGVDHLKAKAGDEHARRRLGAVPPCESKGGGVEVAVDVHTEHDRPEGEREGREGEKEKDGKVEEKVAEKAGKKKKEITNGETMEREGPTSFSARVDGRKGRVLVVSSAASPCVSFVAEKSFRAALPNAAKGGAESGVEGIEGEFSVGVADIVALKKVGGFGWKGKLVVGWATGRDVLDGLEIVDRRGGRKVVTAVKGRDELFNRLVAMGAQRWKCL